MEQSFTPNPVDRHNLAKQPVVVHGYYLGKDTWQMQDVPKVDNWRSVILARPRGYRYVLLTVQRRTYLVDLYEIDWVGSGIYPTMQDTTLYEFPDADAAIAALSLARLEDLNGFKIPYENTNDTASDA